MPTASLPTSGELSFADAIDLPGRLVRAANFALDNWWLWPALVLGFAVWLALKLRAEHALLGQLDERAEAAFADVDALLIERGSLLGNLAEVVRTFAAREQQVIRDVLDGRVKAVEALGANAFRNDHQVANVLQNMMNMTENYPNLASSAHYASLRDDLIRIEQRVVAARRFYNLAVEELNGVRRAFPGNLLAARATAPTREKFSLGERRAEFSEPVKISL